MSSSRELIANNGYEVLKTLGAGVYGKVYLVSPKASPKLKFALKIVSLENQPDKVRKLAIQEVSIMKRISHPNLVMFKDSFTCGNSLALVLTYCDGGDLRMELEKWKESGRLPEQQIMAWFIQITLAVKYLHAKNIIHRDLKSANIFLTKYKIVRVGDLGISRTVSGHEKVMTYIGTPCYMSPEQFGKSIYSFPADVWALGCLLYEMSTLRLAFTAQNLGDLTAKIQRGRNPKLPDKYNKELSKLIEKLWSKEPEDRPTAAEILTRSFVQKHMKTLTEEYQETKNSMFSNSSSETRRVTFRQDSQQNAAKRKDSKFDKLNDTFQIHGIEQRATPVDPLSPGFTDSLALARERIPTEKEDEGGSQELLETMIDVLQHETDSTLIPSDSSGTGTLSGTG